MCLNTYFLSFIVVIELNGDLKKKHYISINTLKFFESTVEWGMPNIFDYVEIFFKLLLWFEYVTINGIMPSTEAFDALCTEHKLGIFF